MPETMSKPNELAMPTQMQEIHANLIAIKIVLLKNQILQLSNEIVENIDGPSARGIGRILRVAAELIDIDKVEIMDAVIENDSLTKRV